MQNRGGGRTRSECTYGLDGLSKTSDTTYPVTTAVKTIAYQTKLLFPAFLGGFGFWLPAGDAPEAPPNRPAASGSSTTRYAVPSGITRTSSSTAISSAPREQRTPNSLGLRKVTFAMVGSLLRGRKLAVPACNTNAFAPAVENAAVPRVNVALGEPPSVPQTKPLEAASCKRAAPARICKPPRTCSVSSLSPANTVAPTEAAAVPICALSAYTTVPEPRGEFPKTGAASKLIDNNIDRLIVAVARARGIFVSMRVTP